MFNIKKVALSIAMIIGAGQVNAAILPDHQIDSDWYKNAAAKLDSQTEQSQNIAAKNVVVFFANGLGATTLTSARIHDAQLRGEKYGEENSLSFEHFADTGLIKTYNTDQQVADTAGSMTAMTTGVKTKAGVIGVTDNINRGDCDVQDEKLHTLLELATHKGMATGLVSTARVTHASAAPMYAHTSNRDWESKVSSECTGQVSDIAYQLVNEAAPINVVLGGGSREFLPQSLGGNRTDGVDLTQRWQERFGDESLYLSSFYDLATTDLANSDRVLGLFNDSHLDYEVDKDRRLEPSLTEMTEAALTVLTNTDRGADNGFFLSVSAGRIAHGHQAGNAARALTETISLSQAVEATQTYLSDAGLLEDTLIVVASDHSYTLSIGGFSERGNSILGTSETYEGQGLDGAAAATDGFKYTSLTYANGPGAQFTRDDSGNRVDPSLENTEHIDYLQQATIPLEVSTSAGEDVPVFAMGPRSYLVRGTSEQTSVFHMINQAAELGAQPYKAK